MPGWNDDDRLKIRALREGWTIPPDKLPKVIARVVEIATGEEPGPAVKAMNALVAAGRLQLATVATEMRLEEHQELLERLKRLEGEGEASGDGGASAAG
jgi:hypothetical protein